MFSLFVRKVQPAAIAGAIVCFAAVSGQLLAQDAGVKLPNVTYTATGTFSTTVVSGNDLFQLAGQPFTINIVANEATRPHAHGKGWGDYVNLKMKGQVHSALLTQAVTVESAHAFIALAIFTNPPSDRFQMAAPVVALQQHITISAKLTLPAGTLTKWLIYPFSALAPLGPTSGTVSYSEVVNGTTETTVLTIATGSLNAVKGAPAAPTTASLVGWDASSGSNGTLAYAGNKFAIRPRTGAALLNLADLA